MRGIKFYGRRFCPVELSFRRLKNHFNILMFFSQPPWTDFCSWDVISWDGLFAILRAVQALTCNIWIGVWLVMEWSGHGMILGIDIGVEFATDQPPVEWLVLSFFWQALPCEWIWLSVHSLGQYPPVLTSVCVCCPIQAVGVQRRWGMLSAGKDLPTWNSKFPVQGQKPSGGALAEDGMERSVHEGFLERLLAPWTTL